MTKLPSNILDFMLKNKQKMTGSNPDSMNSIKASLLSFQKQRVEDAKLRSIHIGAYQNQKGIENEQLYVIRIKGRKNTYYQGRIITFYMFVFDSFPKQPPQIVASKIIDPQTKKQKRFLHINVAQNGQFCMKTNKPNQEYYQYTTLKDILLQLQHSIYYPNVVSSYNNELYEKYSAKGDNSQYYKILNLQAKMLEVDDQSESQSESD